VRRGYDSEPDDGSSSVRGRFIRHTPTTIFACLLKMSPSKGRASCGEEWGGGVTSPISLSSSSSLSSSPEDSGSEGVSSPRALTAVRVAIQAYLLCLRTYSHSL
jgi:hypothetical protein